MNVCVCVCSSHPFVVTAGYSLQAIVGGCSDVGAPFLFHFRCLLLPFLLFFLLFVSSRPCLPWISIIQESS